jgi:hypothetical protein
MGSVPAKSLGVAEIFQSHHAKNLGLGGQTGHLPELTLYLGGGGANGTEGFQELTGRRFTNPVGLSPGVLVASPPEPGLDHSGLIDFFHEPPTGGRVSQALGEGLVKSSPGCITQALGLGPGSFRLTEDQPGLVSQQRGSFSIRQDHL